MGKVWDNPLLGWRIKNKAERGSVAWGAHGESPVTAHSFVLFSESKFSKFRTTLSIGVQCLQVRWRKECMNTWEQWRLWTFKPFERFGLIPKSTCSGGLSPHLKTLHHVQDYQHDALIQEKMKNYRNLILTSVCHDGFTVYSWQAPVKLGWMYLYFK